MDGVGEIIQVNPGKPLPAMTEFSPDPEAESRQHPDKGAAVLPQNDADPQANHPGFFLRLVCLVLPGRADGC